MSALSDRSKIKRWAVFRRQASGESSRGGQVFGGGETQLNLGLAIFIPLGSDAIDSAHGASGAEAVFSQDFQRDVGHVSTAVRAGVFDDLSIHVHNINRAVGSGLKIDRTAPIVGRGEELAPLGRPRRGEDGTGAFEDVAMYEVADRFADEIIAAILRRKGRLAIDQRPAGGRHVILSWLDRTEVFFRQTRLVPELRPLDAPRLRRRNSIDLGDAAVVGDLRVKGGAARNGLRLR